jgi:ribosomal-protein-serine acetyltransferase
VRPIEWDIGDGVVIRTLMPEDAEVLFELVDANRARLYPWMPWVPTTVGPADTGAFIERSRASEHDLEGNGIWLDGRLVGSIGMRVDPMDQKGELGYWIDGDAEGRGIVTRGCERFCDVAFEELHLHRVELYAATENTRSRAVAERLGMIQEGIGRENGRVPDGFVDLVAYAVLADEWAERSR